jgi:hypothetical protein
MDFKTFKQCALKLPTDISICIRGPHGIGKSQAVYQLASEENFNLPIIERRLSQMSEGDMIGLPELSDGTTRFCPPDWYKECCVKPVVLFLDELNRSTPEIMQAAFQIVLDRELNGWKLHPETRIFTAINISADYNVNDMDPALLDRFWVVDLEPSVEDWLEWAKDNCNEIICDFIQNNNKFLEHSGPVEAGRVYPSRRSWKRLNDALVSSQLIDNPKEQLFYSICTGLVGKESSIAFVDYVCNLDKYLSAEDILNRWGKVKSKINKLGNEKFNILIEKLSEHATQNEWTARQAKNSTAFMKILPAELKIVLWSSIVDHEKRNLKNIKLFHKYCRDIIIEAVNMKEDV